MDQQELMAKAVEMVRNDGFTVSDNYLKGADYQFGGGHIISYEGIPFGSLTYSGGGVSFGSEPIGYYIIDADEVPILTNRVVMAWNFLWEEEAEIFFATCCGQDLPQSDNCGHGYCPDHQWDCEICGEETTG